MLWQSSLLTQFEVKENEKKKKKRKNERKRGWKKKRWRIPRKIGQFFDRAIFTMVRLEMKNCYTCSKVDQRTHAGTRLNSGRRRDQECQETTFATSPRPSQLAAYSVTGCPLASLLVAIFLFFSNILKSLHTCTLREESKRDKYFFIAVSSICWNQIERCAFRRCLAFPAQKFLHIRG